jgi:hypothetical protein
LELGLLIIAAGRSTQDNGGRENIGKCLGSIGHEDRSFELI